MLNKYLINIITEYLGDNNDIDFDIEIIILIYWEMDQITSIILNENIPESFYFKYEKDFNLRLDIF